MPRQPLLRLFLFLSVLVIGLGAGPVRVEAALPLLATSDGQVPTLAPMLDQVMPAVVNISTRTRIRVQENPLLSDPFFRHFFNIPQTAPRTREEQSLGSGVIVDAAHGYIVTNNHVIDKADEITVTLRDGRKFRARLVGTDPQSDVAVVQIRAKDLHQIPFGDSDRLRVGDFVVAIGNPFGLSQTVTSGIVSALGRTGLGIEGYEDFIQTDASINPGNSGGPLVDLRGQLVGINTAIVGPSGGNVGIGFAIPSNMVRQVMEQLIQYGEVRRGQLGVYAQDLTPELAEAFGTGRIQGAVIAQVTPNSPAQKAGLRPGDIVLSIDGHKVHNAAELRNRIGVMRVGERLRLEVLRNGRRLNIEARIEAPKLTTLDAGKMNPRLEGAVLANIPDNHPLYGKVTGVMVAAVEPGSPAWAAGLRKGDVITSINRHPVGTIDDARAALRSSKTVLLNIQRGNGALFLLLR